VTNFILLDEEQHPLKWPVVLRDIQLAYPNVSFPIDVPEEGFPDFNVYPFLLTSIPSCDPATQKVDEITPEKLNDIWTQQWAIIELTQQEQIEAADVKGNKIRAERNVLLASCDWTQLPDVPTDRAAWAIYRQELRDVTEQIGFPWDVVWPTPPA